MVAPAKQAATPAGEALTVTQLTQQIDRAIKSGVPETVRVRGEASNVNYHRASGHLYFSLKDEGACIDCTMFRGQNASLKFRLEDGMEVLLTGRVGTYASRSKYQINATRLEPLGRGSMEIAFRQLYEKLQQQGLFDSARKRPLPKYPRHIVLLTSQSTAALQDMLKVFRRHLHLKLYIFHVPVQGDGSAEKIAEAISALHLHCESNRGAFDLILLARGGGSAEDLWEFNEEIIAHAMARCCVPIVTGIGHEVDKSIADFVADHWAHTPTEAAQVAVGHWRTVDQTLEAHYARSLRMMREAIGRAQREITNIERHEFFRRPAERIHQLQQRIDDRQRAMNAGLQRQAQVGRDRLSRLETRLHQRDPRHTIALLRQRLAQSSQRLTASLQRQLQRQGDQLKAKESLLAAISPQSVLKRGYTITTRKKDGAILRSVAELKVGDVLVTRFADGQTESTVRDTAQMRLFE